MLIPGVLYFLLFKFVPLIGSVIAFQDYDIFQGFLHSRWVGFQWFHEFLTFPQFRRLLVNTVLISFYQLVFAFPAPIIIALLLNELRHAVFKRTIQTIVYVPHFLSWVIVGGLAYMLLSPRIGLINQLISGFGYDPIIFLQNPDYTRSIITISGIWKEMGWNAIVFLAALASISPSLYEAAKMDGAGRWRQFLHITLPGLLPVIMLLLLLKIGHLLDLGFEQIYVFLNPMTYSVGDVIDTYTVRQGITRGEFSFTTAIGLFKSVIGFLLLLVANRTSRATTGEGLF
ncbi:MAG: sugar ABC transporter permease [Paenibacillaceae bacterium]|nr:sugar ABC transporter permease [Paenibacillaceae bacterium]